MRKFLGRSARRPAASEGAGTGHVQVEKLSPGRALIYGVAHMLDFQGALLRRRGVSSAEEDMARAWGEVRPAVAPDAGRSRGAPPSNPGEFAPSFVPPVQVEPASGVGPLEVVGYRGPTACAAAGITYRQLDYWARTGLVEPSVRVPQGQDARLYSFRDVLVLRVVKRLLDTGISLQQIRVAVEHLRERGTDDLASVTLMSDGQNIYETTSSKEVVDLLQGGQGVFGIALGRIWDEVDGGLAGMPGERPVKPDVRGKKPRSPGEREELRRLA
jgi:DNA-binding transcriptional MerR regulator